MIAWTSMSFAMGESFSDVTAGKWFYESITQMTESGIFKGYPDGTFKPDNTVTYGEFIKMFVVAVTGEDLGNSDTGHWAENYYEKGIELGLYTEHDIPMDVLKEGMPRKYMAILIANYFADVQVENYDLIKNSILDLHKGKPYQHEIIKAYGLGILTGYPDGDFKPDSSLTRAESATVISRMLNPEERVLPEFKEEPSHEAYWQDDPDYEEMVEWLEENQNGAVYGIDFTIEDGKIVQSVKDGNNYYEWTPNTSNYQDMNKHVYLALKAYYDYAKENDMGLFINSGFPHDEIIIGLRENTRTTNTLFYFTFAGNPITNSNEPNYVLPYVFYNQSAYFTDDDVDRLSVDVLIEKDRMGNDSLVDLNREIFKDLYGNTTGNKIMDYAIQLHKDSFDETTSEMVNLPNNKVNIDGVNIFNYDDNGSVRALYMDKPE